MSASVLQSTVEPGKTTAVVAYMDTRRIPTPGTLKSVIVYVPFPRPSMEEVVLRVQTVARDDLVCPPDTIALGTLRKGQGGKAATRVTFSSDPNWQVTDSRPAPAASSRPSTSSVSRDGGQVTYEITATLDPACPVGNWVGGR